MRFEMLRYEVKYYDKNHWEEISETDVLNGLQNSFKRVTSALQEMIEGRQVLTSDAAYRIKSSRDSHPWTR
jgi:hypothetical protein